ncbi:hypothetical protein BJX70DRAFT_394723 [Aspergillus crustosus]
MALDDSKKIPLEDELKEAMDSAATANRQNRSLPASTSSSTLIEDITSTLFTSTSETTISVTWIGGGRLKHEDEEWTIPSFFRAAAEFPALHSEFSILVSKHESRSGLKIPLYDDAHLYARELLDTYMAFKQHQKLVQDALARPDVYRESEAADAIEVSVCGLSTARAMIRKEMSRIGEVVEKLNRHPEVAADTAGEVGSMITESELWADRLPIKTSRFTDVDTTRVSNMDFILSSRETELPVVEIPAAGSDRH